MYHRLKWSLVLIVFIIITQVTDVTGKYHHIKLRHGRHRRQHADSYLPTSFVLDTNETERGNWGPWSPPSSCSRSCGGGVAHQTRQCLDVDGNGYERCTGSKKRFFSCNIQDCPSGSVDFRAEQCAEYNNVEFEGVFYDWIPYTGGPNKCELNCMPRGERFFYRHKPTVTDGTPCDLEKNDVCVEGKCMPVGCDMLLGSDAREDACRECGGDGSDCNTAKGIFDTDDLQVGYIDILLIPQGATNIVVKENSPSNNYLAVRNTTGHYYLNGNWRIDFPRSLRFAGTIFHYARDPQGFSAPDKITALGPTTEAIYIVLLYQDRNVGVNYEYSIPKRFSVQGDPDSYTWVTDEFSECSATCGGGYKSRKVMCVKRRNNEPVDDNLCDPQLEPDDTQACGDGPCPPEWVENEWGPCSKPCGEGGERNRQIKCEQILAGGIPSIVDDSQCTKTLGPKNETVEKCNENVECPHWHVGPWKPCDHLCGPGKQTRRVTCYKKNEETGKVEALEDSACSAEPLPEREKACESRPCAGLDWIASEWSGCDEKCGLSQETRTVHCATQDGKTYPDEKCDDAKKPELTRKCENPKSCEYRWYASQWSDCSTTCGKGMRSRTIFCAGIEDGVTVKKVTEDNCDSSKKFNDTEECEAEIQDCRGEWFAGPWSKCSKPCGGGDATRKVICMREGNVVPASNCEVDTIMFSIQACNLFTCGEDEVLPVEPDKMQIPTDEDEECEVYEDEEEDFVTFDVRLDGGDEDENEITKIAETDSPFDSTGFTSIDDTMLSDSPQSRGDITPIDVTSGSGYGSGDNEYTGDIFSTIYHTDALYSTVDVSSFEGSGTSEVTSSDLDTMLTNEVTELPTSQVSGESESSSVSNEIDGSIATTNDVSASSDVTGLTDSSEKTSDTSVTDQSIDGSDTTVEGSTELSTRTEMSVTTDSSETSSDSVSESVTMSASELSTDVGTTESSTDASSSSSPSSSSSSSLSSSSSDSSTDATASSSSDSSDTTESTETTITESTESVSTEENVSETSSSTDSSVSGDTDSTTVDSTTDKSSETTEGSATSTSTDVSTSDMSTESPFTFGGVQGEYDPDKVTDNMITDTEFTTDSVSTSESVTDGSTESSTTSVGSSEASSSTEMTQSSEETSTVESIPSSTTDVSSESSATEETTEFSASTMESAGSTESGATTESVEATSEPSTESVSTVTSESEGSTVSGDTTISGETTATSAIGTTISSDLSKENIDEWDDLTGHSRVKDFWSTVSPVDAAITREHKLRKCKIPKKKSCTSSEFGCCYDGVTAAQGPFDKGCPTPMICDETIYGCCPDAVSPATGPNNEGCPFSHCNETLFGCCPDGVTVSEGNENEGCKRPCNETEFGCCPDKETAASGKDNLGCCNTTEFGCCPDGIRAASGADLEGCETEETTPIDAMTEDYTSEYESTTSSFTDVTPIDEDCGNTTYGCCPNGREIASGPNFEGCGVIDNDNCTASYFGCCPDGTSASLGPSYEGCRTLCDNTTYGCCEDNSTPAHGPNQEGCCLTSSYGCCPDNISPARGADFYGCGCEYSRFRCCPDNTTAARGPNNEGCGCQYTPHGCCPNRFTPANGPNFEGCPCYTYQFGCCNDGVTIAKGPHGQGCGCENTEFKCCSDERTPAKGPNFAGCTCESSKYGCCLDGIEESQGENFEGCRSVPTNPGAACGLARDRGPCRDFTVKWFFDTEYGGCSRFWYGGCDGNDNRFKTQEECKDVCVQPLGKDVCYLPKISGPCEGYYPNWYYDSERKQCGQFIYGGCLGNGNRFETREQCEGLCTVPDNVDPCDQPKESGPCQGNFTRWHFNKDRQACEQFNYGGCKANDNNYPTEIACHQQCLQPGHSRVASLTLRNECSITRDPGPCPGSLLRWYHDAHSRSCRQFVYGGCKGNVNKFRTRADCERHCSVRDSCSQPRDEGNCTEKHSRWFFDRSENRCMPFYYTGCGGNSNNFDSRDACESDCPAKIEQDICLLPALLGECHNYTQRWFYDSYEQRCRQFYYGGCGGNGNNFETEHDCAGRCEKSLSTPPPPATEFKTEFCFLPDERGPCTENHPKWFYDSRDGICKQFQYGGCEGNRNRFETREECDYRCGEVQDPCAMPKVVGPCNGFVKQFYYDRRSDTCEEFEYSGCAGNKNRFQDRAACEIKCQRRIEPERRNETSTSSPVSTQVVPISPVCLAPVDAGPCDTDTLAYYYDAASKSCQAFVYGGCKGNANRFETEEQCERLCGRFVGQDVCNLPAEPGLCRGAFPKVFYDPSARACRHFVYGGCEGNANRFSTIPECESLCVHREEPAPAGNDTALSHLAICRETVDIGSCSAGNYKRFYFDEERQTCMPFLYTGCGGNRNNFKTFESCLNTCFRTSNEIDVGAGKDSKDPCAEAKEECDLIRCPYGKEAYVDDNDCGRCRCVDPCRVVHCPEGTKCSITLVASGDGTEYRGVCRSTVKPGNCPIVSNSTRCELECTTDADCNADTKCCNNGCGTSCLDPASEEPLTTSAPVFNVTAPQFGAEQAAIKEPDEPRVKAEEGSYVTMKCIVVGNPRPAITWRKDSTVINPSEKRRRILTDGSLQIVNLYSYDRGTYVCMADNGLAPPARIEYQLEITEPHEHSAAIVGEPKTFVTVTMNSPTVLHCYAMGWPRPFVTWWRGDRMLPLSSEYYEQDSDYTLLIRSVSITNLGVYTCQAYNGIERPASWSVTLQAIGPVYNLRPDQMEYAQYLVQPPKRPERPVTDRPQYPYRPVRTRAPANQTYIPIRQTVATPRQQSFTQRHPMTPPGVLPIVTVAPPSFPNRYRVPVSTNVATEQSEYPVGSDISLGCSVDGYPIPTVLWYKNDQLISTDERIKISESNRLLISSATQNDTGTYRCEATNEDSMSSSSVEIRVDGLYIHPDCQDNAFFARCDLIVKAEYCQHKYYAKFCCRSCTEAGQLPASGPHLNASKKRRRRSALNRWLV